MTILSDFLASLAREPFCYGQIDCALPLADWWRVNHGIDPAAHLRGIYADRDSCLALVEESKSLLRLVRTLALSVGAVRTHEPKPGDFGVVGYGRLQFGAIRTQSGKWAIKCGPGLRIVSRCRPLMMWSI